MGMCTASYRGKNTGCPHPKVESADSSLCARHLLIAANDVNQIGKAYLVAAVKDEEAEQ